MMVGAVQVGTFDQLGATYKDMGITNPVTNCFCAAMTSGKSSALCTVCYVLCYK